MNDELGNRMKNFYENRTRYLLPRRTYTIIRIDGKAFHTYTRGLKQPFDAGLIEDMNETAQYLCKNIQGAKFAFVQSDEISILLTDFETIATDAWFDGNIQKIASVSASMATAKFNHLRMSRIIKDSTKLEKDGLISIRPIENDLLRMKLAEFDSRLYSIPSKIEVKNYFIWRQADCVRNSIQSVAQSLYSHSELNNKNTKQMQEMIWQKGINWNNYDSTLKRGRFVIKESYEKVVERFEEMKKYKTPVETVIRTRWIARGCPIFSQSPEFLDLYIPNI